MKMKNLSGLSQKLFGNKIILLFLLIINVAGFFAGLYFYYAKLVSTPAYLWILVLDSPISAALFAGVCLLRLAKRNVPLLLYLFTFVYTIKYALWTFFVVLFYWHGSFIQFMVIATHVITLFEGILVLPLIRTSLLHTSAAAGYFLLNDFFDYVVGTLQVFPIKSTGFFVTESVIVSVALPLIAHLSSRKK